MKKLTTKTLLMGLLLGGGSLAADAQSSKIVVGIVVDQLRTDYLQQLQDYFGESGFKRLIKDGVFLTDVDFKNSVTDSPTGTAVIYTGAWPSTNGVASAEVLDATLKRNVPVLATDPNKARLDYSPQNLRLSTIADELIINNGSRSKVYSISGDPQEAVISAGHAGTAAIWFDESTGKWTTPSYYGTLPVVLSNQNRTSPLSSRIASIVWRPLHNASYYQGGTFWSPADFSYTFGGNSRDTYTKFKASAPFNAEVTDAAIEILKSMRSGATEHSGMLNIGYSVAPYKFDYDGDNRPELIDSYIRLDSELGKLLDAIYKDYGKNNAIIFLSSTGKVDEPEIHDSESKIPTGEITLKKTESLLNSYLSATYGNGDYVLLIKNGNIYLDAKAIEKKGLDISKIRKEAKTFLLRMGGISEAFTIDEVTNASTRRTEEIAAGIDPKNVADIFIFFTPGWTVVDDNVYPPVSEKVRLASPAVPAFILAPDIRPQTINTAVEATVIAPTVSSLMRIRAPNGASGRQLILQ